MATPGRRKPASLIRQLISEPHRFELFQAVRLLQHFRRRRQRRADPLGEQRAPTRFAVDQDTIRYQVSNSLVFPATEVSQAQLGQDDDGLQVSVMGLQGMTGVLPRHYTETVQQSAKLKSFSLRDLLDLFNHRALTFHGLAARKYRVLDSIESAPQPEENAQLAALSSLVGLGTQALGDRLAVEDEVLLYYAGRFAQKVRSAAGLADMLTDYVGREVEVIQFQGAWSSLSEADHTRLGSADRPTGVFAQLGVDAVCGDRVFDVQGTFRLKLGPLDYPHFAALMPGTAFMNEVADLTRAYVGGALAFEIELDIRRRDAPPPVLSASSDYVPRLGWNMWLSGDGEERVLEDAVFSFK